MWENSYLPHFSALVSQLVFLAYLTVLRLFTTVWPKMSENSYLRHFSAQVSQSVFLAYLTVLWLITTVWPENVRKLISPPFQRFSVTTRVLSLFESFYDFLQLYDLKFQKISYLRQFQYHKYHKSSFLRLFDRFTSLLQPCMTWNVRKLISPPF